MTGAAVRYWPSVRHSPSVLRLVDEPGGQSRVRIAVANVKGGAGKSTSVIYLAAAAAESGPVVVVDADPQGSAGEWLAEQPIAGVTWVTAPSERAVTRAVAAGAGTVIVDTPPGSERIVRAALRSVDTVVVPTRAGSLEVMRVRATVAMIPAGVRHGLVITAARTRTRDYRETLAGWAAAGEELWGTIPERVAAAAGPDGPLVPEVLDAYRAVLAAAVNDTTREKAHV